MVVSGEYTKGDIAKKLQCSRQWVYELLSKDDVKTEIDKRLSEIRNHAGKRFDAHLDIVIDKLYEIITTAKDVRTVNNACQFWIERSLGRIANNVELEVKQPNKIITDDDILSLDDKITLDTDEWERVD